MTTQQILAFNGGSSTLRIAVFTRAGPPGAALRSKVEGIGTAQAILHLSDQADGRKTQPIAAADHASAVEQVVRQLASAGQVTNVAGVGHRIVQGRSHVEPQRITPALLSELRASAPLAPEHLTAELAVINAALERFPGVPQLACFDTSFHRTMPRVATLLPIPRRLQADGVQRYGYHGLSYQYLLTALEQLGDPTARSGRVILAHLGNGASITAVRDGRSVDTSMALTPAAGLMMGTRTGDVDPGLLYFLSTHHGMSAAEIHRMANHASGLLGVSETSADMRDLLSREVSDQRAAEAIALFCYQVQKWIGAFVAVLGGLDTLVFTGGIGENAPVIRGRICRELNCFGIDLDAAANGVTAAVISAANSRVTVRVIPADEEQVIATEVNRFLS